MKMRSKIVTCLLLALSISCLATGCKKKAQETETSSETIRVTEKQTDSETAKKATNTSTTLYHAYKKKWTIFRHPFISFKRSFRFRYKTPILYTLAIVGIPRNIPGIPAKDPKITTVIMT